MKKLAAILTLLALAGCAHGVDLSVPKLPGPADDVDCKILRAGGSMEGVYECTVKGRYIMEEFGIF